MTYGEKFKEVFGYYPYTMPCPEKCPPVRRDNNYHECSECEYFADFREKEYEEEFYCDHCERKSCMHQKMTNFDKLHKEHVEGGEE